MKIKNILIVLICLSMIITSGCWDKIEIDERAFVLAMVVDKADSAKKDAAKGSEETKEKNDSSAKGDFKLQFYMPVPSKLQGGNVDTFTTEESQGRDIPEAIQRLSYRFSRKMFFGQTKILLIGEKALKDEKMFREMLDFIEREPDMGREMQIAVVKGKTDDLSNIKPKFEKVFAAYMKGVFDNSGRISSALSISTNQLLASLRETNGRAVIPVIRVEEDKAVINELAMINNYKLLDYFGGKYLRGYSIFANSLKDGGRLIDFKDDSINFRVTSFERRIWLESDGKTPKYKLKTRIEGDVNNYIFGNEVYPKGIIKSLREKIVSKIDEDLKDTVYYFQNKVGYDFLRLGDYTHKYYNSFYEEHKDNWDDVFKKAKIEFDTQVFVRRIGGVR